MKIALCLLMAAVSVLAQAPQPSRSPSPDGMASVQLGWRGDDALSAERSSLFCGRACAMQCHSPGRVTANSLWIV